MVIRWTETLQKMSDPVAFCLLDVDISTARVDNTLMLLLASAKRPQDSDDADLRNITCWTLLINSHLAALIHYLMFNYSYILIV